MNTSDADPNLGVPFVDTFVAVPTFDSGPRSNISPSPCSNIETLLKFPSTAIIGVGVGVGVSSIVKVGVGVGVTVGVCVGVFVVVGVGVGVSVEVGVTVGVVVGVADGHILSELSIIVPEADPVAIE